MDAEAQQLLARHRVIVQISPNKRPCYAVQTFVGKREVVDRGVSDAAESRILELLHYKVLDNFEEKLIGQAHKLPATEPWDLGGHGRSSHESGGE